MPDPSWNALGRFYGITPGWLAAYNGEWDADLDKPATTKGPLRVPTAQDLVEFLPQYQKRLSARASSSGVQLPPPTLTNLLQPQARADVVPREGNAAVVLAARMRRFGHTGDNYQQGHALRTLNPRYEDNAKSKPDAKLHTSVANHWKCNILVGDSMYAAGFDWPMSEHKRYLQPKHLLPRLLGDGYATALWVSDVVAGKASPKTYRPPTYAELANVLPGDIVLMHVNEEGHPGHVGVVTGAAKQVDGKVLLRVLDIYGESWYDVDGHSVGAIVRPQKKLAGDKPKAYQGDARDITSYLDGGEDISDAPVLDERVMELTAKFHQLRRVVGTDRGIANTPERIIAGSFLRDSVNDVVAFAQTIDGLGNAPDYKAWKRELKEKLATRVLDDLATSDRILERVHASLGTYTFHSSASADAFRDQLVSFLNERARAIALLTTLAPERAKDEQRKLEAGIESLTKCSLRRDVFLGFVIEAPVLDAERLAKVRASGGVRSPQ